MYQTKQFLSDCVSPIYMTMTLEELSFKYQETPSMNILATAFYKVYNLAIQISNNYYGINDEDLASYCLEKLDYCLKTYKSGNKFATYFYRVYANKLREETENLNCKKRKGVLVSINEIIDIGLEDTYNLLSMTLPKNLTDKERKFCMLASEGFDNNDIAKELKVSKTTVYKIIKSLQNKLFTLQSL